MQRFQVLRTGFDIRRLCQRTHFRIRGQEGIKLPFSLPLSLTLLGVESVTRVNRYVQLCWYQLLPRFGHALFFLFEHVERGLVSFGIISMRIFAPGLFAFLDDGFFFFFFSQSCWRCKEFSFDFIEFLIVFVVYFFVMAWFARGSKDKRAIPFG